MHQGLEANQESLLSASNSSFSTRDSLLLSNNLGLQAQKASNRIRKSMISAHSNVLLAAEAHREDAEVSKNPWLNAAISSANSLCWGSSIALKESSESCTAREGSSQALSELDQSKGDSVFFHRTPSFSCIESSECYDSSGAETTTRIDLNGERLRRGKSKKASCSKSKEVDAWAIYRGVSNACGGLTAENMEAWDRQRPSNTLDITAPTDNKMGIPHNVSRETMEASQHKGPLENRVLSRQRASSNKLEALDLLIYAAIQVGFLDDEDDQMCDVPLKHPKRTDCASNLGSHNGYKDGFPVHLSSPILKKRVVRRARSAFSKQTGSNMLQRLGIASPAENLARKLITGEKKVNIDIQKDDSFINKSEADHTQQQNRAIQYTRRGTPRVSSEQIVACKPDVSEMLVMKNGDVSKHGILQALPTKTADACDAYMRGGQVKNRPCRKPMKQPNLQGLPTSEGCGSLEKPPKSAVGSEMCEGISNVEYARGQKNSILEEEEYREASSEVDAQQLPTQANSGGSVIRLKIRPMRLPSQVFQQGDILEGCEYVSLESQQTITRKSKRLHVLEQESTATVTMHPTDLMLCDSSGSLDTGVKDVDVSNNRSKRSRSQVLPTKFSDSVLQPWKRAYKKK